MTIPDHYIQKIQAVYANSIDRLEFNQDGMNNDVVIVNQQLVYQFAKTDWAKENLKNEVKVLQIAQQFIELPTPHLDHIEDGFVSYPLIPGKALSRNQLLKLDSFAQEKVIEQLGQFLYQLHSISQEALAAANIATSVAERSPSQILNFYEQVQQVLFPYLWKHQHTWVHEHFELFLSGSLHLDSPTNLVHGDLGCYHILFDPTKQVISGVIDFGTAGIGNSAIDLAALLDNYGELIVERLSKYYPAIETSIDQARFQAGLVWLQWAMMGVQHQDTGLLLAHIGSARDILPVGSSW